MKPFDMIDSTLIYGLCFLAVLLLIQLCYYFCLYNRIYRRTVALNKGKLSFSEDCPPLSVVVCAHDASDALRRNLPSILEQNYPKFEVIVVNDDKSEETNDILTLLESQYSHLYHTFTPNSARYISHKKLALTVGIKASKYDWLVVTEPECIPACSNWLRTLSRNFTPDTDIVLGYARYRQEKGWFHRKVAFHNLLQAMRYLGLALLHKPYMGIGRNLAYRKKLFFENKGFSSHLNLEFGDDDLFINETCTNTNTRVETHPDAIVELPPITYQKEWRESRLNYTVTSSYYQGWHRYLLGAETSTRLLFCLIVPVIITYSLIQHVWPIAVVAALLYLIRFATQLIVFHRTSKSLQDCCFYLTLPLFDILQPFTALKYKLIRHFHHPSDFLRK